MSDTAMLSMGNLNRGWGICGFTSTFYAMYKANPAARGALINASDVFSVLYEITDYLKLLQSAGSPLVGEIERFTRSFGPPYDTFTVPGYIASVDKASTTMSRLISLDSVAVANVEASAMSHNALFGIAMPPQAVADYIQRVWKWRATIIEYGAESSSDDAVVGVRDVKDTTLKLYHGLCHYLYRSNNVYYSWGNRYGSLTAANRNYKICYAITLRKY